MPAFSPARAANVATHAWTKFSDEFMSLTISGIYECRSCHAWLALPEATSTTVHICNACEWPTVELFECTSWIIWMHSYKMAASKQASKRKQASKHTHTCAQCSHTSVGLAQARPNKYNWLCTLPQTMKSYWFDTSCLEMSYVHIVQLLVSTSLSAPS